MPPCRGYEASPAFTWWRTMTMTAPDASAVIVEAGMAKNAEGGGVAEAGAAAAALFATNAPTALVGGRGASTAAWIIEAVKHCHDASLGATAPRLNTVACRSTVRGDGAADKN